MGIIKAIIKFISLCVSAVIMGVIIGLVAGTILTGSPSDQVVTSKFTHDDIIRIQPDGILDEFTLRSEKDLQAFNNMLVGSMVEKGMMVNTPIGLMYTDLAPGQSLDIIVQSPGGLVSSGLYVSDFLNEIRSRGITITCHVSKAASMGFYIIVTGCDKVIAKKDSLIMQHRVSYPNRGNSPSTQYLDIVIARREAKELGVDFKEWMKLTKGERDHEFTKEEADKYKIVDEWVD